MIAKNLYIGAPKNYQWEGQNIVTSIFRGPVQYIEIKDKVITNNYQANYKYHGGRYKEVYSYAIEDYEYWKKAFQNINFSIGSMGENITTEGLDENQLFIGDQFKIGSVILEVSQPRLPCSKLNVRLNSKDAVKLFLASKKFGVYYQIIQDGKFFVGDNITYLGRDSNLPKIQLSELAPVLLKRKVSDDLIKRILQFKNIDPAILDLISASKKGDFT